MAITNILLGILIIDRVIWWLGWSMSVPSGEPLTKEVINERIARLDKILEPLRGDWEYTEISSADPLYITSECEFYIKLGWEPSPAEFSDGKYHVKLRRKKK